VNPKGDKGAMSPLQMQKKVIFMKKGELKKKKECKKTCLKRWFSSPSSLKKIKKKIFRLSP